MLLHNIKDRYNLTTELIDRETSDNDTHDDIDTGNHKLNADRDINPSSNLLFHRNTEMTDNRTSNHPTRVRRIADNIAGTPD